MKRNRTLKKKEVIEFTNKLLGLFRHLVSDYNTATNFRIPKLEVGDWAIETTYLGKFPLEGILKITGIGGTSFSGVDLIGEKRTWENADFIPLPKHCQDFLNGKYRF